MVFFLARSRSKMASLLIKSLISMTYVTYHRVCCILFSYIVSQQFSFTVYIAVSVSRIIPSRLADNCEAFLRNL